MATSNPRTDEPMLTVIIRNREPLRLADIAPLLAAIGNDYSQITGRELTLRAARQGSLELQLIEAARTALSHPIETAATVVTMKEFAGIVIKTVKKAKAGIISLRNKRVKGAKTADGMVQVARASHADVELEYQSGTEKLSTVITREEAEQLYNAAFKPRKSAGRADYVADNAAGFKDSDLAKFAIAATTNGLELDESNAAFQLLKILLRDLKAQPNWEYRLGEIEKTLRGHGQIEAALLLRRLLS